MKDEFFTSGQLTGRIKRQITVGKSPKLLGLFGNVPLENVVP